VYQRSIAAKVVRWEIAMSVTFKQKEIDLLDAIKILETAKGSIPGGSDNIAWYVVHQARCDIAKQIKEVCK
jgi:hypothetical protein